MLSKKSISLTLFFILTSIFCFAQEQALRLFYDRPAKQWEETLPLGNGRLGMTPDGGVEKETIVLNDITLWSGAPQDANNYNAYKVLPKIQQLLLQGKNDEAQALIDKDFICTGKGSGGLPFGCFQMLGTLNFQFDYGKKNAAYSNYSRGLSLGNAIAYSTFKVDDVTYKKEYFTSFSDDVDVIRIACDKPGRLNFKIALERPERFETITSGSELIMEGQLDNGTDGKGMRYYTRVKVRLSGGTIKTENNALVVINATAADVFVSEKTDYKDTAFIRNSENVLNEAFKKSYTIQKAEHCKNYQKLFNRVSVTLGKSRFSDTVTDRRIEYFRNGRGEEDNTLPVLFFQYGRYLSISSTRVGLLPPNLQGLWANQVQTPWNGDYHLDVNVQMNHWGVEVGNLPELDLPLTELVKELVPYGERTAKAYYNANGWIAHVITNLWHFTEPGESASWGVSKSGAGWLCNNLWQHYDFTNDKNYLKEIYPVLKGSAQFYSSILIKDPQTGWLVTAPSSSPENSFYMPDGSGKHASICIGATIDNQIIRELFNNVITAAGALKIDKNFSDSLQNILKQIPPSGRIAPDGRLMEWLDNYKETDPQHRHISHLYGLYPANLITPESTPDLAEACKKTLNTRGDDGPSWSIAYKLLFWARLHDGNRAYTLFKELIKPTLSTGINYGAGGGVYPNLLSAGPPFQIDGNFGACAGIAEMLLQSHAGFIHLLPAIPTQWNASGEVRGLKARGNITVDFKWKNGKVISYKIKSPSLQKVKLKINNTFVEVTTEKV